MRDATEQSAKFKSDMQFQSTHPMRDATWDGNGNNSERDFNPRIPCGMRQKFYDYEKALKKFQSTHPMRDATNSGR